MKTFFQSSRSFFSEIDNFTTLSVFFLAAGILTSVSVLGAYQLFFAIPLIYFGYLALKNQQWQLPVSGWFLLIFVIVATLSLTINFDIIPKPGKNFGRLKYYIYGLGGIYVFRSWALSATMKTRKFLVSTFLLTIIVAGLFITLKFVFFEGDNVRARGFTDTMRYGYGSGMLLLTLLSALLQKDKTKEWLNIPLGITAFIIGLIGMYVTYTRGALLGFFCGLPFVLYFYKPKWGLLMGSLATIAVLGLSSYYFFGTSDKHTGGSRLIMTTQNKSDVMRRSQWKAAIIAIQERPVLGWGLSNFHTQLKRIKNDYNLEAKYYNDAHAHNLFLEIASGTGLIGLFFFLGWLISWAIECYKAHGLTRALVVPFGVAFVISSQFEVTFDANNACMIFFLYSISSIRNNDVKQGKVITPAIS